MTEHKIIDPAWLRQQRDTGQRFERPRVIELMIAYEEATQELRQWRQVVTYGLSILLWILDAIIIYFVVFVGAYFIC